MMVDLCWEVTCAWGLCHLADLLPAFGFHGCPFTAQGVRGVPLLQGVESCRIRVTLTWVWYKKQWQYLWTTSLQGQHFWINTSLPTATRQHGKTWSTNHYQGSIHQNQRWLAIRQEPWPSAGPLPMNWVHPVWIPRGPGGRWTPRCVATTNRWQRVDRTT